MFLEAGVNFVVLCFGLWWIGIRLCCLGLCCVLSQWAGFEG